MVLNNLVAGDRYEISRFKSLNYIIVECELSAIKSIKERHAMEKDSGFDRSDGRKEDRCGVRDGEK